jgi:prepilin-type N-terminal cleavage/methylation domain-containing protein
VSRAGQRRAAGADDGFTLIELAVAMVVFGVLVAISSTGWNRYQASQEGVSASGEVVSVMRNAQMRATAEATTYRVDVDAAARTLTVYRYDGAGYVKRTTSTLDGGALQLDEVGFEDKLGASTTSAYFYARGTASPGKLVVGVAGREVEHVVRVEGLTGRVWTT